jgi:hypothetical protein
VGTVTHEEKLRTLLLEAFKAGQAHMAYDEGLRGAEPALGPEEWVETVAGSPRTIDYVDVEMANVLIDEFGRRIWVCTEEGTVLRIRAKSVTLEDRRLVKE